MTHPTAASSPLSLDPQQLRELEVSSRAYRGIGRAITYARWDGWGLAFCSLLTLLFAGRDVTGIVIGALLGIIAAVELTGCKRLRQLDPSGARLLGFNQLGLATLLILYAVKQLVWSTESDSTLAQLSSVGGQDIADISRQISRLVYFVMIAVAILFQGGLALFYFSRRARVIAFVQQTPPWIVQMRKANVLR